MPLNPGTFKQFDDGAPLILARMHWALYGATPAAPAVEEKKPAAAAAAAVAAPAAAAAPAKPAAAKKKKAADSDDDFGMSSDDEDDDDAIQAIADKHNKAKQEKFAASGKSAKIDKSMLTIFVKPLESETDMNELAKKIMSTVQIDSLVWGVDYKLEPVAYGILKAKMVCSYEDLKCSPDDVIEAVEAIEEVQSCDMDSVNILG